MLEEGDIIVLESGHRVYAYVPEHFVHDNRRGHFELTHSDITLGGDFDYLCGRYVVYKTAEEGGSWGYQGSDFHPNGHHVFCERLSDRVKVDFYQSGSFSALIEKIEPVGKATRVWVEEVDKK